MNRPAWMEPRSEVFHGCLTVLAIVFIILRLWAYTSFSATIYAERPIMDAEIYHNMAMQFYRGHWQDDQAFWLGPGWPALMAMAFKIAGHGLGVPRLLNMLMSFAALFGIVFAGKRVGGGTLGLLGGLLWTCWRPGIFHEQTLLMESSLAALNVLLIAILVYLDVLIDRYRSVNTWMLVSFMMGILIGFSALFRSTMLVFGPLAALAMFMGLRKVSASGGAMAGSMAVMMLGAMLSVAPATIHNWRAEHEFIPIGSNLGINLWIGMNPKAEGDYQPPPSVRGNVDDRGGVLARRILGKGHVTSSEVSKVWTSLALEGNWLGRFPRLALNKLALLLQNQESPQVYHIGYLSQWMAFLRAPLPGQGWVTFLFFPSLVMIIAAGTKGTPETQGTTTSRLLIVAGLLINIIALLPFFVTDRYRISFAPWFILVGEIGIAVGVSEMQRRSQQGRILLVMAALVALIAQQGIQRAYSIDDGNARSQAEGLHALLLTEKKHYAEALPIVREVNMTRPTSSSLATQAKILSEGFNDWKNAAPLFMKSAQMEPDSAKAWFNAGQAFLRIGELAPAEEALEKCVAIDRDLSPEAWYNLAAIRMTKKEWAKAQAAVSESLRLRPGNVQTMKLQAMLSERSAKEESGGTGK